MEMNFYELDISAKTGTLYKQSKRELQKNLNWYMIIKISVTT